MRVVDSTDRYCAGETARAKALVRAIDNDGGVFEVASVDGVRLADLATQFLADRRVNRLNIHLAADDSYAGRMVRHDNQQASLDRTSRTFDRG
jgi:hypothetical protein